MPPKNDNKENEMLFLPWGEPVDNTSSVDPEAARRALDDATMPKLSFDDDMPSASSGSKSVSTIDFDNSSEEPPATGDASDGEEPPASQDVPIEVEEIQSDSEPALSLENDTASTAREAKTASEGKPYKIVIPGRRKKPAEPAATSAETPAVTPEVEPAAKPPKPAAKPPKTKADEDEGSPKFLLRLIIVLSAICVFVAVLLAIVNAVTEDRIDENTLKAKTESVLSIFDGGTACELLRTEEDGSEVYLVLHGEDVMGYCTFVSTTGFGGAIDMMVGLDTEYKTEGVRIVTMSETPGVGTKTNSSSFLDLFKGGEHDDPNSGVDVISGATVSSEAVMAGVLKAHGISVDLAAIATERGVRVLRPGEVAVTEEETTVPETTAPETTDVDITSADTADVTEEETTEATTAATEADPEPEPPYNEYRPGDNYQYPVDGTELDPEFDMEVNRGEETATFTTETETPEPTEEPETTQPPETTPATTEPPATTPPAETTPETTTAPETTAPETTIDNSTMPPWLVPPDTVPDTEDEPEDTMPPWLVPPDYDN